MLGTVLMHFMGDGDCSLKFKKSSESVVNNLAKYSILEQFISHLKRAYFQKNLFLFSSIMNLIIIPQNILLELLLMKKWYFSFGLLPQS